MQTLYLVLNEKQSSSDLRGSVMMVILLQMRLNKFWKKKDKMDNLHNWPADQQFDNHGGLQSSQSSAKKLINHLFSL